MELEIIRVLQQSAGTTFSHKEIGKIVARSEFRDNPHWARPILEKLVFEGLILKDGVHYFYPTEEMKAKQKEAQRRQSNAPKKP